MPSPLPFVHLFISRMKAPLPFLLLLLLAILISRVPRRNRDLSPTNPPPTAAEGCRARLSARCPRIPRRKSSSRGPRRNRFAPLRPEGQSIAPVCVRLAREARFHDATEIARAVSPRLFPFLFFYFPLLSPLEPLSRISSLRGTGRCEIAINRFDQLAAIHLSTSLRPTYLLFSSIHEVLITSFSSLLLISRIKIRIKIRRERGRVCLSIRTRERTLESR